MLTIDKIPKDRDTWLVFSDWLMERPCRYWQGVGQLLAMAISAVPRKGRLVMKRGDIAVAGEEIMMAASETFDAGGSVGMVVLVRILDQDRGVFLATKEPRTLESLTPTGRQGLTWHEGVEWDRHMRLDPLVGWVPD